MEVTMRMKVAGSEAEDQLHPSKVSAEFARARRRKEVAERYLRGMTQAMIAEELKVSTHVVSGDLTKIMEAWISEARLAFEERKAKELARIDHVEELAHRGWLASIEKQEVHRSLKKQVRQAQRNADNKITGHKMVPVEVVEEVLIKGQSGDPRFLDVISHCIEMRLRILGLWKGDTTVNNAVILDWTQLFAAQAEEASKRTEQHVAHRTSGLLNVEAKDVVDSSGLTDQDDDDEPVHRRHTSPTGISPEKGRSPSGVVEVDPIEERLRMEELKMSIKLPDEEVGK